VARKTPVTPAIRALRKAKADYTGHLFDYERFPGAELAADALGVDPHHTAKTIVFVTDLGQGVVVIMHGDQEVSTRKVARLLGVKTIRPATQREADRITGYQFGGTSPLGMRTDPPVFAHRSLASLETLYVNGGSRGFLIEIAPSTLFALAGARLEDVAVE